MSEGVTEFGDRQAQSAFGMATVELPLPLLASREATQSAFFGLCVTAGKQVLEAMMEADRTAMCSPSGMHDGAGVAGRAGMTASRVLLGGREIALRWLRVRSAADRELTLPSFKAAASVPLDRHTLEAIASGVSSLPRFRGHLGSHGSGPVPNRVKMRRARSSGGGKTTTESPRAGGGSTRGGRAARQAALVPGARRDARVEVGSYASLWVGA